MKTIYSKILALVIILLVKLLSLQSLDAQPWPDQNFCVVSAKLIYNDSVSLVTGHGPLVFNWDDGSADNYFLWILPGGMVSVKYKPPGYPMRIIGGSIYVGDGSFPEGADFIGNKMRILLFDDDGLDNLPGSILDSVTITVNNFGWVTFDGLNTIIREGEFYIGTEQLYMPPFAPPVGVDEENPVVYKSYAKQLDSSWKFSSYHDFMIRAFTCDTQYVQKELEPENESWYELALVSDFNPDNGEDPEDGLMTIVDSLPYFYYQDTMFYTHPPGYYAYAVRVYHENKDTTGWYFSNTIDHTISATSEEELNAKIQIFPNPVVNELSIKSQELIRSVEFFNVYGQKVFSRKFENMELSIETGNLIPGLYFLKVKTEKAITTKTILKY